jgi:GT2 family glycosyltransferase
MREDRQIHVYGVGMSEPKTASTGAEHEFTIVIPVFNMANTIGQCLESITALDYDPDAFEVIVVDNMSTDDTRGIVAKFPVKILDEKVFQSSYAARNTGIAAARGKLIAFTDADCVVDRAWLAEIAREIGDESFGCFAGEILSSPPTTLVERFSEHIGLLRQKGPISGWHHRPYAQTANAVYRREVFNRVGFFHPTVKSGGDADIAWRMQSETQYKIKFVPKAVVYHHHRTDAPALYSQFRRYGTGKLSWATYHSDYKPPSVADLEKQLLSTCQKCLDEVTAAGGSEAETAYPILRILTQAAHFSGYVQGLLQLMCRPGKFEQVVTTALSRIPRCSICGGTSFVPGPNKRLSSGAPPRCNFCGSLERHRVLAALINAIPCELKARSRLLTLGERLQLPGTQFADAVHSDFRSERLDQPDHSFDWVVLNYVLQDLPDAEEAFTQVRRVIRELGMVLLMVPGCASRLRTSVLPRDDGKGPHRQYGADLTTQLTCSHPDFRILLVVGADPVTFAREWIYFLSHDQRKLNLIAECVAKTEDLTPIPVA